jgi:two-component sensor histidine kinase
MSDLRRCSLSASPDLRESLARLETRILAFGKLHKLLLIGAGSDVVSVESYVEQLCKTLSDAILEPQGLRCEVHVDAGVLSSDRCELLGLVITELVTNAAKHAFFNRVDGLVRVDAIRKNGAWVCTVSDNGEANITAARGGVGSEIIGQLVRTLGGHFVTRSCRGGTSVAVTCPITKMPEKPAPSSATGGLLEEGA